MSLLDCICCPEHVYRTAVVSDDLKISSAETYGFMMERACILACYLRRKFNEISGQRDEEAAQPDRVVAILSESCSEALSAIVGILAVPASFMPLSCGKGEVTRETKERLRRRGVRMALVHHSCAQDFFSAEWSDCCVTVDTTTLQLGFLCVIFCNRPLPSTYVHPFPSLSPVPTRLSPPTEMWGECTPPLPPCVSFPRDSMTSYHSDTHHRLAQCILCSKHSAKYTTNDNDSINSQLEHKDGGTSEARRKWSFPALSPTAVAYIVHTSGTTGPPKSVRVPHCSIVPNVLDLTQRFSVSPNDIVFNAAPLTFDPSIVEIFLALYNGATLLTVSSRVKRSPHGLADALFRRNTASVLQITPSLFRRLPEREVRDRLLGDRSSVRTLALGGEQFPSLKLLSSLKSPSNSTLIFNIYGTTEVSSWSTCRPVTKTHLQRTGEEEEEGGEGKSEVPLGDAMLGTKLEVRDSQGKPVVKGYGEIYLGGEYRVCLLGDETSPAHSVMRPTGDRGWVSGEGDVFFVGRLDRQMKRWGHGVSLEHVEQCVGSQDSVRDCAAAAVSDVRTLCRLFPMALQINQLRLAVFAVPHTPPSTGLQSSQWAERLMTCLAQRLPGHMVPDIILPVHHLPFNKHGKVDIQRLLRLDNDPSLYLTPPSAPHHHHHQPHSSAPFNDVREVQDALLSLVKSLTHISLWPQDSTLLDVGATSFDVVRIADTWEGKFGKVSTLTELLLSKTFREVVDLLWKAFTDSTGFGLWEREIDQEPLQKRARKESLENFSRIEAAAPSCIGTTIKAWRRGKVYINGEPAFTSVCRGPGDTEEVSEVAMTIKWTYDTGRCVDASPLVAMGDQAPPTVYIGSHSGMFVALCVLSGRCLWEVQLSDRIESSACLLLNGARVVVGCYDGYIYCLRAESGEVKWSLQLSREPVKSSPCVDMTTELVWVGSHDQHLYAIHGESGRMVHRVFLGGGSCFSSPCLNLHRGLVYAATLRGNVVAVNKDDGSVLWSYEGGGKPFFSSPCLLPSGELAIGSVDGSLHVVNSSGTMARVLRTGDSVFSSPAVAVLSDDVKAALSVEEHQAKIGDMGEGVGKETELVGVGQRSSVRLFCGSHDKCIYCWNGDREGEIVWRTCLDSELYASPAPCNILHTTSSPSPVRTDITTTVTPCVCVSTSSGVVYLLDIHTGKILGSLRLPGQVFSSAAVVNNHILVGCRDNHIYCIKCSVL